MTDIPEDLREILLKEPVEWTMKDRSIIMEYRKKFGRDNLKKMRDELNAG